MKGRRKRLRLTLSVREKDEVPDALGEYDDTSTGLSAEAGTIRGRFLRVTSFDRQMGAEYRTTYTHKLQIRHAVDINESGKALNIKMVLLFDSRRFDVVDILRIGEFGHFDEVKLLEVSPAGA